MTIQYKIDVMAELKAKGYTPTRIRNEKIFGQSYLTQLRRNEIVSLNALDTLCRLLECNIGDIIEYVPDKK